MARIRTIKPDFFRHEGLFEVERASGLPLRIAFAGLWTAADREGRFKWAPRALKLDCLPYDDMDFGIVLDALAAAGFIQKYAVAGESYGFIPSWDKHQTINSREAQSKLPVPNTETHVHACEIPVHAHGEGKGREGKEFKSDAEASPPTSAPKTDLHRRGKEVFGPKAGGLVTRILNANGGNVALARALVERASTMADPREYASAAANKHDPPGSEYGVDRW